MEFQLTTPESPSPTTGVVLARSIFQFPDGPIIVAVIETHADGTIAAKDLTTTDEELAAYFSTPVSPVGFRATFAQAFIDFIQGRYPSAQVTG